MVSKVETLNVEEKTENLRVAPAGRKFFYRILASLLMSAGFLAPLFGIILFIIHSFIDRDRLLSQIGSAFIIATIPTLLIGSHFMDKADEKVG